MPTELIILFDYSELSFFMLICYITCILSDTSPIISSIILHTHFMMAVFHGMIFKYIYLLDYLTFISMGKYHFKHIISTYKYTHLHGHHDCLKLSIELSLPRKWLSEWILLDVAFCHEKELQYVLPLHGYVSLLQRGIDTNALCEHRELTFRWEFTQIMYRIQPQAFFTAKNVELRGSKLT